MKKLLPVIALCTVVLFAPLRARACASVSAVGDENSGQHVDVTDESAIIVWDVKSKTQHFIRRASFDTTAKDIGFLVPTPNTPQLAEADDSAFGQIDTWMKPKTVYQTRRKYDFTPFVLSGGRVETVFNAASATLSTGATKTGAASKSVTVIAQEQVAGYDATILAADNIPSLNRWLKNHKYVSTPALMKWLQPYVARGWKITAFKISKPDSNYDGVASRAVRMSFRTERPFFPYREPAQKRREGARSLRVYFFAPQRMTGAINGKLWVGKTVWTDSVPSPVVEDIAGFAEQLDLSSTRFDKMRLTVLEDRSTTRFAPDDVYFQPAFDQSRIVPPPNIRYRYNSFWLPADVLLLLSCGAAALLARWKRSWDNKPPIIKA